MKYILGLDLGSNSLGWSAVYWNEKYDEPDNEGKIIDMGVSIFDTTLSESEKPNSVSKNLLRRGFRLRRRNIFRRKYRLSLLMKRLKELNFIPDNLDMLEFFKINPYEMRHRALDEQISLVELSRIFYLFAKRRGFLSSRKGQQSKETKIDVTDYATSKVGINDNTRLAEEYTTIGNYLYSIYKKDGQSYKYTDNIRNRVLTRKLIHNEFEIIWNKQKEFYPDILTNENMELIGDFKKGVIFYQKPLKSQKFTIANCSLEPNKKRCYISRPEFEEFRAWQFVNNIKFDSKELTLEEKKILVNYSAEKSTKISIPQIKKKLKKLDAVCNYNDDQSMPNMPTTYIINNILDKKYIQSLSEDEYSQVKAIIWEKMNHYDTDEKLTDYLRNHHPINEDKFNLATKPLADGYGSYSLKAVNNILPFLRMGHNLYISTIMGGIRNALGDRWNNKNYPDINQFMNEINEIFELKYKAKERNELIKELTINNFHLDDKEVKKLYFAANEVDDLDILDKLPNPDIIKNPTVMKILNQLKKIVNSLIDKYGHPYKINIELARNLKQTQKQREETMRINRLNEKNRENAKIFLEGRGMTASNYLVQKYLLFKEMEEKATPVLSPYTGKPISLEMVFSPDNMIEIEHIVPFSISLDNSLANKTLCEREINQLKGNRTPYQFFKDQDNWKTINYKAFKILPYQKALKFVREDVPELDSFVNRQLNDTRYASKVTAKYMKHICNNVQVSTGQITSKLRELWGLNNILINENDIKDGEESEIIKNRDDHRHHALDAAVIAMINPKILHNVSNHAYRNEERLRVKITPPWQNFRDDLKDMVDQVLVCHEFNDKVLNWANKVDKVKGKLIKYRTLATRGQLHNETVYGKGRDPFENRDYYYIRKNVAGLTPKQIQNIASIEIKNMIIDRISREGITIDKTKGIPDSFVYSIENNQKVPKLFIHNKNGDKVPVLKVRVKINSAKITKLYDSNSSYVDPSNNHHISVYRDSNNEMQFDNVTFWDAVRRVKNGESVINNNKYGKLINIFKINYMYIIGASIEEIKANMNNKKWISQHLYRGQSFSEGDYNFRHNKAATSKIDDEKVRIRSVGALQRSNPIRIKMDILGNIVKIYD